MSAHDLMLKIHIASTFFRNVDVYFGLWLYLFDLKHNVSYPLRLREEGVSTLWFRGYLPMVPEKVLVHLWFLAVSPPLR